MAREAVGIIKLQIPAGQANPAPPVGPALGQQGVNIMEFCKAFNAQTQGKEGTIIPVVISVYADKSFTFIMKSPPASALLKQAAALAKGSSEPGREGVGQRDAQAARGDSGDQERGFEQRRSRRGRQDYRGYGPEHGDRGQRVVFY